MFVDRREVVGFETGFVKIILEERMMKKVGLVLCLVGLLAGQAPAVIYVDAEGGPSGNTVNALTGSNSDWWTTAAAQDGLWGRRAFGYDQEGVLNGPTKDIFEASGTGSGVEDCMAIVTTISGLTPGRKYQVDVVYWSANGQNWTIRVGFSLDSMILYDRVGNANIGAIAGTRIGDIQDGDRWVFTGTVGTIAADGNGQIRVYIDDLPGSGWNDRTWYDGLFVEIPEPMSCLLLAAGSLCCLRRKG